MIEGQGCRVSKSYYRFVYSTITALCCSKKESGRICLYGLLSSSSALISTDGKVRWFHRWICSFFGYIRISVLSRVSSASYRRSSLACTWRSLQQSLWTIITPNLDGDRCGLPACRISSICGHGKATSHVWFHCQAASRCRWAQCQCSTTLPVGHGQSALEGPVQYAYGQHRWNLQLAAVIFSPSNITLGIVT